jgi:Terpene cyclase DEP1
MKAFYLAGAIAGAIIPYARLVPWLAENGLNAQLFVGELFSTRIGAFFGLDVLVSAVILLAFIRREGLRMQMDGLWIPVAATCLVGVSCGLPLFLYMREHRSVATNK